MSMMFEPAQESRFRLWLYQMWYEHLDELDGLGQPAPKYTAQGYFKQHKYWLKNMYRQQRHDVK
jgi:hypothetical protein